MSDIACMPDGRLYPLLFEPIYKTYIWGGTRIGRLPGRDVPAGGCAESWELSDNADGLSIVSNGPLAGRSLDSLIAEFGEALLGQGVSGRKFPLLIKILDAREKLSVQVHPDESTASVCGGEPKTEMWYVLDAEPDAMVYLGFDRPVGKAELSQALQTGELAHLLRGVRVSKGMVLYVPGGRIHAIGAGCMMLEVQQTSNTTYRLYDWGRVDKDGKSRDLHVDQALKCIMWDDKADSVVAPRAIGSGAWGASSELITSPFFRMSKYELSGPVDLSGGGFNVIFVERGTVTVGACERVEHLPTGRTCLVPACIDRFRVAPVDGTATVIRINA